MGEKYKRDTEVGLHVDDVLYSLNPLGRYQLLHAITYMVGTIGAAFQLFSNVFTAKRVPHHCAAPLNGSSWTSVFGEIDNFTVVPVSNCEVWLMDNGSHVQTASCVFGNEFDLPDDASALSQFSLVCDMDWLGRLSQTMVILGQGFGAVITTMLSDRCGRKPIFVISNFGLFACGMIIAYAPNVIIFMIFKFVIGGFQQGVVTTAATFALEVFPTTHRAIAMWAGGAIWCSGSTLLALLAFIFKGSSWRTLQTAMSLFSLWAFFVWCFTDESFRWLVANGKSKPAVKAIKRMARMNKQNCDDIIQSFIPSSQPLAPTDKSDTKDGNDNDDKPADLEGDLTLKATSHLTFLDILKVRRLLLSAACMWAAWFTTALSFFTIYLTATSLSGDPYLNFALTALMELPSNIFFYFFVNRLGRRRTMTIMFAVCGTGLLISGIFRKLEENNSTFAHFTVLASLVSMTGASGCFGIVFSYTPEMFPTNLRNQAVGVSSFVGRMGGMLAPFAGLLAEQAVWAPGLLIGILCYLVCVLTQFLPETMGRELPQTLGELKEWYTEKDSNCESYNRDNDGSVNDCRKPIHV